MRQIIRRIIFASAICVLFPVAGYLADANPTDPLTTGAAPAAIRSAGSSIGGKSALQGELHADSSTTKKTSAREFNRAIFPLRVGEVEPDLPPSEDAADWFAAEGKKYARALVAATYGDQGEELDGDDTAQTQPVIGQVRGAVTWRATFLRGELSAKSVFQGLHVWLAPVSYRDMPIGFLAYADDAYALTPTGFVVDKKSRTDLNDIVDPAPSSTSAATPAPASPSNTVGGQRAPTASAASSAAPELYQGVQVRLPDDFTRGGGVYAHARMAQALHESDPGAKALPVWDSQIGSWFVSNGGIVTPMGVRAARLVAGPASLSDLHPFIMQWWGVGDFLDAVPLPESDTGFVLDLGWMLFVVGAVVLVLVFLIVFPVWRRHHYADLIGAPVSGADSAVKQPNADTVSDGITPAAAAAAGSAAQSHPGEGE